MSKLHYILPCCLLLLSIQACYTQRKAETQIRKADVTYPSIIPNICATRYPPKTNTTTVTEYRTDTVYNQGDTMILGDTVYITRTVTNTVKTTITDTVENTAKIDALSIKNDSLKRSITTWQDQYVKAQDKADRKAKWQWWAIGSWLVLLVGLVIFIIIKLKTIKVK